MPKDEWKSMFSVECLKKEGSSAKVEKTAVIECFTDSAKIAELLNRIKLNLSIS